MCLCPCVCSVGTSVCGSLCTYACVCLYECVSALCVCVCLCLSMWLCDSVWLRVWETMWKGHHTDPRHLGNSWTPSRRPGSSLGLLWRVLAWMGRWVQSETPVLGGQGGDRPAQSGHWDPTSQSWASAGCPSARSSCPCWSSKVLRQGCWRQGQLCVCSSRGLHSPLGARAGLHPGWPAGAGPEGLWAGVVGVPSAMGCLLKVHTLAMEGAACILAQRGQRLGAGWTVRGRAGWS